MWPLGQCSAHPAALLVWKRTTTSCPDISEFKKMKARSAVSVCVRADVVMRLCLGSQVAFGQQRRWTNRGHMSLAASISCLPTRNKRCVVFTPDPFVTLLLVFSCLLLSLEKCFFCWVICSWVGFLVEISLLAQRGQRVCRSGRGIGKVRSRDDQKHVDHMDICWRKLPTTAGDKTPVCVEKVVQGERKD